MRDAASAVLLRIWEEAGRHIELEESFPAISHIVSGVVELEQALVVTVSKEGRVEVLAQWDPPVRGRRKSSGPAPEDLPPKDELERAVQSARPLVCGVELESGPWIALALSSPHRTRALLLLRMRGPVDDDVMAVIAMLDEPLSAALEHDARVHELEVLREAAEAEKRSALARLGREGIADTVIGRSGGLRRVMERVELVARSDVPVLILGETGSGKEVVAREIHRRSPRSTAPFLRVNCGAIPSELIDSELFGHEKGAFTGASTARRGWFERADGGTLLLDEVGELALPAQVRLLRVLQEGTFERVGGERPIHVDVRIVAATHRDLPSMISEGRFREDLWYRIAGFPLLIPPLRDRSEDLEELAEHFALRAARRFGLRPFAPTPEDIALLASYHWPGNIRELQSVIDRAALLGAGTSLDFGTALMGGGQPSTAGGGGADGSVGRPEVRPASLNEAMKSHIEAALRLAEGRVEGRGGAAELLEINPHTLRGRMRRLDIDWARFRPR